jgi:hypothetical protein
MTFSTFPPWLTDLTTAITIITFVTGIATLPQILRRRIAAMPEASTTDQSHTTLRVVAVISLLLVIGYLVRDSQRKSTGTDSVKSLQVHPTTTAESREDMPAITQGDSATTLTSNEVNAADTSPATGSHDAQTESSLLGTKESRQTAPPDTLIPENAVYSAVPPGGTQPEELDRTTPRYPVSARRAGVQGPVVVRGIAESRGPSIR